MKVLEFSAKRVVPLFLIMFVFTAISYGQQPVKAPTPTVIIEKLQRDMPLAVRNNLYCAGYIQSAPLNTNFEIVGADREQEKNVYAQGDYVYITRAANANSRVGDVLSIVRPRGTFKSDLSKKGILGIYVQEVGTVEIVKVREDVSVARVKTSCDNILLGDIIHPVPHRFSPEFQQRPALDVYSEFSGKAMGRIVLARDGRETLSREEIVYIDLGEEDNVQIGDYLTIFRPLGKGGIVNSHPNESASATDYGYQSKVYRGGKFSMQAPRKNLDTARGERVTSRNAKEGRPKMLRKVVGEMVILNVKERTATALITRNVGEIHTGDMVEVQ